MVLSQRTFSLFWLIVAAILLLPSVSDAQFVAKAETFSVCSSSSGTLITDGIPTGMIVNVPAGAASGVCVVRMDAECSTLTTCIGAPIAVDSAVGFYGKEDGDGRYCGILKTGSTCVTVGRSLW